jgi:hypothetical protein
MADTQPKPKTHFMMSQAALDEKTAQTLATQSSATKPLVKLAPQGLVQPSMNRHKMKWGEPIWTMFHAMAQKVNQAEFSRLRTEIIDFIRTVCHNLPCPECTAHATEYISKINWNAVLAKDDLINVLYVFHNVVNQRKGVPAFPKEMLTQTYGSKNMHEVCRIFMYHFEDRKTRGPTSAIATKFHRLRIASNMKSWINRNIQHFNS